MENGKLYVDSLLVSVAAVAGVLIFAGHGLADSGQEQPQQTSAGSPVIFDGRLGLGYLTGESQEYVFDPASGRKVSELTWELTDIYMLNGGISIRPLSWVRINMDLWLKLTDGNGDMDDYDWFVEGLDWTHWSHTDDLELTTGFMLDMNVEFPFYSTGETSFSGFVGYKYDTWEWEAKGGNYIYSVYSFRDTAGSFPPGESGITYEQWFHVPYVGIGFNSRLTNVSFHGRLIASPFVQAGDEDHHHMRNLLFEEDFDNGSMVALDIGGGYHFTEHLALLLSYHYQKYNEMKGDMTITDQVTGQKIHIGGDVAGVEHNSSLFSLTLSYTF